MHQAKTLRSSQAKSERVQILRQEYWQEVADTDLENLVFIDEMGVLLGLARTNARALPGDRAYDFKPFYRGSKVSVIGAISSSKILAVMTIDKSMNSDVFEVYISKLLVPQLWPGAVVVCVAGHPRRMDNLPAHKGETIVPLIEAVGAKVLYMSPYSPEFNPIEHLWSQLKAFLRLLGFVAWSGNPTARTPQFSPTTSRMVDILLATAIDLINPIHLRNWFAHCCYCPS